jgi:hypothetical protein
LQLLLQALNLLGELLIAVLQLLDLTREVADRSVKAIDPGHQVGGVLRARNVRRERAHKRYHKKQNRADYSLRHFR